MRIVAKTLTLCTNELRPHVDRLIEHIGILISKCQSLYGTSNFGDPSPKITAFLTQIGDSSFLWAGSAVGISFPDIPSIGLSTSVRADAHHSPTQGHHLSSVTSYSIDYDFRSNISNGCGVSYKRIASNRHNFTECRDALRWVGRRRSPGCG